MACPFLKEGRAQYCHAAPVQKLILDGPGAIRGGLCSSAQYVQCELAAKDSVRQDRCPHLEEIRVQYCGVSPVTKLVPFSDSELSSCTSNTYRYCDSYLLLAHPHASTPPPHLLYTANHFWLDAEESGLCHIGLDGAFADVAGDVDGVTYYVTTHGTHSPTLALTVHGVEWPIILPKSTDDSESEQPRAERSHKADGRSLWRRLAIRGMGIAWPHTHWASFWATRHGLARRGARAFVS